MEDLKKKLAEAKKLIGTTNMDERRRYDELFNDIKTNHTSDEEKEIITQWWFYGVNELKHDIEELKLKAQLKEVTDVVSLSYIAQHYFNHTKSWLYQRINGNIVKGKPAKFTNEELKKLQFAINDIGNKLAKFQLV